MYVSLLRVIATMARITTTSRAAAMTTAVTGLRPKICDRSLEAAARGSAETSSFDESVWVLALASLLASGELVSAWLGGTGAAEGASVLGRAGLPTLISTLVFLLSAG